MNEFAMSLAENISIIQIIIIGIQMIWAITKEILIGIALVMAIRIMAEKLREYKLSRNLSRYYTTKAKAELHQMKQQAQTPKE